MDRHFDSTVSFFSSSHENFCRKSTAANGSGSGGVTEDEEELRKLAVAVDNFQTAVADVSQFQRNFLNIIRTSEKYGGPDQGNAELR